MRKEKPAYGYTTVDDRGNLDPGNVRQRKCEVCPMYFDRIVRVKIVECPIKRKKRSR